MSAEEFEKLDYRVMGHAYASQNELGRLCDECAYHADLKARLLADDFGSVLTEVPITVTHRDFSKKYFTDLIADNGLYELKVDSGLVPEHDTQLLNYMLLLGVPRAKLLNFRPSKVQGKIIASGLTQSTRRQVNISTKHWKELSADCATLKQTLCDLLRDWGAFLEISLYQEALIHFFGGQSNVERRIRLARGGIELGNQQMLVHSPGIAFRMTAVTEGQQYVASHLRRLLALTDLEAIQWINLNHAQIEFTTINSKAEE